MIRFDKSLRIHFKEAWSSETVNLPRWSGSVPWTAQTKTDSTIILLADLIIFSIILKYEHGNKKNNEQQIQVNAHIDVLIEYI